MALFFGMAFFLGAVKAEAALVNFDDGFSGAIGTHYSSDGVVFDQGWQYSNYGSNVSNPGQAYGEADNSYNGVPSGDVTGHFVLANTSTDAVTDFISLWGTWLDYGRTTVTLTVYDLGGATLGSVSAGGQGAADQEQLSLNISGIHSFDVHFVGQPSDDINAVDDLSFHTTTSSNVPEPSTLLLLGSGMIGLAALRKRVGGL
ncbi:MAG: PEP-CTERM sorting domain-containing protein [Deltaproteobacteria bacterium]|nr:PEP-CTERM sorting domain-containing protein [Deltaproteobacteria bacterium]